jgi:hypothetical protein
MSGTDGEAYVVPCAVCNQPWHFAGKQEAWKFWINHRDHYGHRAHEPVAARPVDAGDP